MRKMCCACGFVMLMSLVGCAEQNKANDCFISTVKEAANGNFEHWVLPDFIGGKHLRAGQYLNSNCQVIGK